MNHIKTTEKAHMLRKKNNLDNFRIFMIQDSYLLMY